jgi:hypothetical protein
MLSNQILTEDTVCPILHFRGDLTITSGWDGVGLANDCKTDALVSASLEIKGFIKVGHLVFLGRIVESRDALVWSSLLCVEFSRVVHIVISS